METWRECNEGPLSLPCLFKRRSGSHLFLWTSSGVFWGALWQLLNNLETEESQKSSRGVLPVACFSYEKSVCFCWCLSLIPVTFQTHFVRHCVCLAQVLGGMASVMAPAFSGRLHAQQRAAGAVKYSIAPWFWYSSSWLQPGNNLLVSLMSRSSLPACWPQKPILSLFAERLCSPGMKC